MPRPPKASVVNVQGFAHKGVCGDRELAGGGPRGHSPQLPNPSLLALSSPLTCLFTPVHSHMFPLCRFFTGGFVLLVLPSLAKSCRLAPCSLGKSAKPSAGMLSRIFSSHPPAPAVVLAPFCARALAILCLGALWGNAHAHSNSDQGLG